MDIGAIPKAAKGLKREGVFTMTHTWGVFHSPTSRYQYYIDETGLVFTRDITLGRLNNWEVGAIPEGAQIIN